MLPKRREGMRNPFRFGRKDKPQNPNPDFSQFGGKAGAKVSWWDAEDGQKPGVQSYGGIDASLNKPAAPKNETGINDHPRSSPIWDDGSWDRDIYGRTGAMKETPSYGTKDETEEQETARGARMKVSKDVTVLGNKSNGGFSGRRPVDADTRARGEVIQSQNKRYGQK